MRSIDLSDDSGRIVQVDHRNAGDTPAGTTLTIGTTTFPITNPTKKACGNTRTPFELSKTEIETDTRTTMKGRMLANKTETVSEKTRNQTFARETVMIAIVDKTSVTQTQIKEYPSMTGNTLAMVSATLFITEIKLPLPSEDTERPVTNCVWFFSFCKGLLTSHNASKMQRAFLFSQALSLSFILCFFAVFLHVRAVYFFFCLSFQWLPLVESSFN